MGTFILILYAILSSLGLILLKLGSKDGAPISITDGKAVFHLGPYIICGILLYGISFVVYTYLISKHDLGYIVPVSTALVYIFIFTASFIIFKEAFTAIKIFGICFILMGLILLNLSK